MIELKTLITFFVQRKMKLLEQEKNSRGTAKNSINSQMQLIEELIIFLNKRNTGELNMDELDLFLDEKAVPLAKHRGTRKNSALTELITKVAHAMPPMSERRLNPAKIDAAKLASKLSILRRRGVIPKDVTISQAGKDLWLIRK